MDERHAATADWLSAQQKYWDAWLDLARQTQNPGAESSPGQSTEVLLKWWEAAAVAPPATRDLLGRLVGMSQSYLEMAEKFAADTTQGARTALDRWLENMEQALSATRESAGAAPAETYRAVQALWGLPFENWRHTLTALSPDPQAQTEPDPARLNGLRDQAERLWSMPAIGYTRETQEQYQRLARLNLEYLEALQAYELAFGRLAARSIERCRAKLDQPGEEAPSLRRFYDLWIDACEEVYREYATSDEYALLYARVANALAAVRRQTSVLLDDALEALNLPTRREIDTMHRRIHLARRENHALRAELEQIKRRLPPEAPAPRRRPRRKAKHR